MSNTDRPRAVVFGVALLVTSNVLALLRIPSLPDAASTWTLVVLAMIPAFGLILGIWYKRNWARLVFLIWFLLGVISEIYVGKMLISAGAFAVAFVVLQCAIQGVAFILLFSRSSNGWFHRSPPVVFEP